MNNQKKRALGVVTLSILLGSTFNGALAGSAIEIRGELSNLKRGPVGTGTYDFVFSVYDAKVAGRLVWEEPRAKVEVREGAYRAVLGSDLAETLPPGRYWLETEIDGETLQPRAELNLESATRTDCSLDGNLTVAGKTVVGSGTGVAFQAKGSAIIGTDLSRGVTPPVNGLLVEGQLGVGVASVDPAAKVQVENPATNGYGIYAQAFGGSGAVGVYGSTTQGTGVYGNSTTGVGVRGDSDSQAGVMGVSNTGWAGYFLGKAFMGGRVGILTTVPQNLLDVNGNVVVGGNYAGSVAAPSDSLLVEGIVGIGTTNPQDKLSVAGGVIIGADYAGAHSGPPNGLMVEGAVGIGTNTPYSNAAKLHVQQSSQNTAAVLGISNNGYTASGVSGVSAEGRGVEGQSTSGKGVYGTSTAGWAGYFPDRTYIGTLGVGTTTPVNRLDVSGGAVIGSGYASTNTAPPDGLAVEGQISVGSATPNENAQATFEGGGHPIAVFGTATQEAGTGVLGTASELLGTGVEGVANNGSSAWGIFGLSLNGQAGHFLGDVEVIGTMLRSASSFQIDDPIDPANKTLSHSSVESPDMMNLYNGNVVLDQKGEATVTMPRWFESLNRDFRYQLTAMGQPGPDLYIAQEISGNQFRIGGGEPGMKVSWQVSGIRHDAFADAHRIEVEQDKPAAERGHYIHPDLFGQPEEKGVDWARKPELMQRVKAQLETKRAADSKSEARSGRNP